MKATAHPSEVLPRREQIRFPFGFIELLRSASSRTIRLAIAAVAVTWAPAAILAALHGFGSLRLFLVDYAAQSRLLLVIPMLIVGEPPLVARMSAIAHQFQDERLVTEAKRPRFDRAVAALKQRGEGFIVNIVLALLVYVSLAFAIFLVTSGSLMPWCYGSGGILNCSPAGTWYVLVGFPMVFFLLLRWVWRQLVWLWFLAVTARMDLQLIPSHPDRAGGLSFVEQCMRGYLPFGFAIGTIVAGGLANRVVYLHQPVAAYRYMPLLVIAIVLILCVGPLCVLWSPLLHTRSRGIFEYGALATRMGRQFEHKWLEVPDKEDGHGLEVQDFSATIDLYSVVANVHEMRLLPVGMRSVSRLAITALAPAVPLAFIVLPLDVIMKEVIKMLL